MEHVIKENYLRDLTEAYALGKNFHNRHSWMQYIREKSEKKKIVVYGVGLCGQTIAKWLGKNSIKVDAFCDSNPKHVGQIICDGTECISYKKLCEIKDECFVIVAVGNHEYNVQINQKLHDFKEIIRNPLGITIEMSNDNTYNAEGLLDKICDTIDLFEDDISKEIYIKLLYLKFQHRIIDYPQGVMRELYTPNQYIVPELFDYKSIHSVIDCGAYIGDSISPLIEACDINAYYAFEMDQEVYKRLALNVEDIKRVTSAQFYLYNKGVGKINGKLVYESDLGGASCVSKGGCCEAEIVRLDEVNFDRKIDFIKMDIEGSEEDALEGARDIIKRDKPILAISMYHSLRQFIEIPHIIKSIDSNYQLYVRHHRYTIDDTVLYGKLNME